MTNDKQDQTFRPERYKLGTRRSPLAMAQAHEARDRLAQAHGIDPAHIEIVAVTASGDRIQDRALAEIGGKALWTKELDAWLASGEIDFAVHSAKDVETIRPGAFTIGAILPREDVRDVLVGAESIAALPPGAVVGTSAPRRAAQLLHARPDCKVVTFRGNVATRLAKLAAGRPTRRSWRGRASCGWARPAPATLDAEDWLPAPAQAAIMIECRADDERTRAFLAAVDDAPSRAQVLAERALLAGLGGNCHSPIAVLTRNEDAHLVMRAALYSPDGAEHVTGEARFPADDAEGPGRLAADLLARAVPAITVHFAGA
ncbi:hydroxymethylbilane synthase [Novosphingobium resinovorum]